MSCATCGSHKHHDIHRAPFGEKRKWEGSHPGGSITGTSHTFVTAPEKPETPEQIAERLEHCKDCGAIFVCSCGDGPTKPGQVLAALREVEARGEQRAAALGGALLDSAIERAEKAERDLRDIIENDEGQRERANKAEAERDECIEIAAKAIGSEYRNVGVVQALATWASQLQQRAEKAEAERDTMLDEEKRLEDFSDRMEHGFNEAQDELAEMRERAEKAEAEVERLRAALTACQVAANDIAEDNERLRDRLNGELK